MAKKNKSNETLQQFLEREYGDDILRPGDKVFCKSRKKILKTFPSLDISLNGGIPEGTVCLFSGSPKTGKCVGSHNTFVVTEAGLLSMIELKNLADTGTKVITHEGIMRDIKYWYDNGTAHVFKIKTKLGGEISITDNHPLLILDNDGTIKWKKGIDISIGDILISRVGDRIWGKDEISTDDAYIYGLLIGDGYLGCNQITLTNVDDFCINSFNDFVNKRSGKITTYRGIEHRWSCSNSIKDIFSKGWYVGEFKQIPEFIRRFNEKSICSVLRGYFDADGGVEKNAVKVTTKSKILATQIRSILLNLGIVCNTNTSRKRAKKIDGYSEYKTYYTISIYETKYLKLFKDLIGFSVKYKKDLLDRLCERCERPKRNTIPNVSQILSKLKEKIIADENNKKNPRANMWNNINRYINGDRNPIRRSINKFLEYYKKYDNTIEFKRLIQLVDKHLYFDKIIGISEGEEHTSDINVDFDHSFVGNGLINHNTTICVSMLKNAINEGRPAYYIDIEKRLTTSLIDSIDVDKAKINVVGSEQKILTAEDYLNIIERIIKSEKKAVIVVDSIAMLSTMAEQEEQIGYKGDMSGSPKLIASFFRRCQQPINANKNILIFISQVMASKSPYGPRRIEKGGVGIQYACSVWLQIKYTKRWDKNLETNAPDGHDIHIDVLSSALGRPLIECKLPLKYGIGIDKVRDIVNIAEDVGIIEKAGSWYKIPMFSSDNNEFKIQGINQLIDFLANNNDKLEILNTEIYNMYFGGQDDK